MADRFVCRREGHKPAFRILDSSGIRVTSYITTCVRCGKAYEIEPLRIKATGAVTFQS